MLTTLPRRSFLQLIFAAAAMHSLPRSLSAAAKAPFALPPLPYPANALEPHIDARTMEIHHGKHHAAYVNNLNKAVEATPALQGKSLEELLLLVPTLTDPRLQNTVRNNGGGDWNHTFFWEIMSPASESGQPSAELKAAIETSFGSLEKMQEALNQAALGQFGSGWAWLIKKDGKLAIVATPNQDNPLMKGTVPEEKLGIPLLGVDVWEHAYYLNYQNRRADYLKAWWNVVNWKAVSDRFAA